MDLNNAIRIARRELFATGRVVQGSGSVHPKTSDDVEIAEAYNRLAIMHNELDQIEKLKDFTRDR